MNWLSLRVNLLEFSKTTGKLPILLEESMEYIDEERPKNVRIEPVGLGNTRIMYAQKIPRTLLESEPLPLAKQRQQLRRNALVSNVDLSTPGSPCRLVSCIHT